MEWTEEAIATLRRMHADGISAVEIGKALGLSRSAVLGKVWRLGLAAPRRGRPARSGRKGVVISIDDLPDVPARGRCQYPIGNPGEDGFAYCGEPAELGRPYCTTHRKACYRKPAPRGQRRPHPFVFLPAGARGRRSRT